MLANLNLDLFWSLFNPGIPLSVYVISFCVGILGSIVLMLLKSLSYRHILTIWLTVILFLMLYSTVIGRESQPYHDYHLIPFWSFHAIQEGFIETLYEKVYNVLFFVPYGFLSGLLFRVYGLWSSLKKSMAIGSLTSVGIEILQLITRTGTCETDDVICNTFGCLIGAMIGVGICALNGKIRN